jgi:transcription elongation factor GreA
MPDQPTVADRIELTSAGRDRLAGELAHLRDTMRPGLAERGRNARLFLAPTDATGIIDMSERDLASVNGRIARLEAMLANAQIIGEGPVPATVQAGFPVTVRDDDGRDETLTIVSSVEADPSRGLISNESPAGRALLGKPSNSTVHVDAGADTLTLTVVRIGKHESRTEVPGASEDR